MQTAQRVFNRLTEVEKINLRNASPDRIAYLADTSHRVDFPTQPAEERAALLTEVAALCHLDASTKSAHTGFGLTWKF